MGIGRKVFLGVASEGFYGVRPWFDALFFRHLVAKFRYNFHSSKALQA
jgi:hypothetical protein